MAGLNWVQKKVNKAKTELKTGWRITNKGQPKMGKNGRQLKVTKSGKAYRQGYLDARNDIHRLMSKKKQ